MRLTVFLTLGTVKVPLDMNVLNYKTDWLICLPIVWEKIQKKQAVDTPSELLRLLTIIQTPLTFTSD